MRVPGQLVDELAIHFLDTFRYLAGDIERVFCQIRRRNPVIGGEDFALIHAVFASGSDGLIDANRVSVPPHSDEAGGSLRLEGDRGMLRMSADGQLWLSEYGGSERAHVYPRAAEGYRGDSVRALQEHIASCLRSGARAESEANDYLKTTAAVFACYQSADSGAPVAPATLLAAAS